MNKILNISNAFNLLAQALSKIGMYHFGYLSDLNNIINNNFTKGSANGAFSMGNKYIAVIFEPPDYTFSSDSERKTETEIVLYFCTPNNVDEQGQRIDTTKVERLQKLTDAAYDMLRNFYEAADQNDLSLNGVNIPNRVINCSVMLSATKNKLMVLRTSFTAKFRGDCNTFEKVDTSNISAFIPVDNNRIDLEKT